MTTETIHTLKTWPEYFEAIRDGRKRFELRRDDRGFKVGDRLRLEEWDPAMPGGGRGMYTGRVMEVDVTYLMKRFDIGAPELGIDPGWCLMGISAPSDRSQA